MTDYENLDNIEACGECGTFHDARFCPSVDLAFDDEAPFCEEHPDTTPKMVRGVEGDDIGYECPDCKLAEINDDLCQLCRKHKATNNVDGANVCGPCFMHY